MAAVCQQALEPPIVVYLASIPPESSFSMMYLMVSSSQEYGHCPHDVTQSNRQAQKVSDEDQFQKTASSF